MKVFDRFTVFLSKAVDWLNFIGYAVVLVVLFVQIVARYFFSYGIVWSDEFSRYVMVWLVMLCSATLVREKKHIRLTILDTLLPKSWFRWVDVLIHVFILVFAVMVFRYSLINVSVSTKAVSTSMRMPMTLIYAAFPVSMAIMAINALLNILVLLFRRGKSDIDKEGMVE